MNFIQRNIHKFSVDEPKKKTDSSYSDLLDFFEKKYVTKFPEQLRLLYIFLENNEPKFDYCHVYSSLLEASDSIETNLSFEGFYPLLTEKEQQETCFSGLVPENYPGDENAECEIKLGYSPKGWTPDKKKSYTVIAYTDAGYILIGMSKENNGQIFLWDSEYLEEENPFKMFNSLADFVDAMYEF